MGNPMAEAGRTTAAAVMALMAEGATDAGDLVELAFQAAYIEHGGGDDIAACREAFFTAFADEVARLRFDLGAAARGIDPTPQGVA